MLNADQEIESFDDDTVVELDQSGEDTGVTQDDIDKDPSKDTFENNVYKTSDKDSQTQLLDEEEDDGKKSDDKDQDAKKEEKEEEKKSNDDDKKQKTEKEEKGKEGEDEGKDNEREKQNGSGKSLKIKDGDKTVEISPDSTIKVKVKGKNDFVTVDDLKKNYEGKQAWSEKIESANTKLKEADLKISKFKEEKHEIAGHLQKISEMIDKEDGDPLEAMYYLLDMTGRDVNTYSKRVFDFMEEQIQEMSEMDETEKELYWTRKKLDSINSNQAAKARAAEQEQAHRELIAKVDRLRESHGVSEEQYIQAHDELVKLGIGEENITPEQVINYSAIKPYVEKAESIASQFEDDLSDDEMDELVSETANVMRKRPELSEQESITIAAKMLGYDVETIDDDIDKINEKVGDGAQQAKHNMKHRDKEDPDHIESFDDFDYY